jgi:hypothetical protein
MGQTDIRLARGENVAYAQGMEAALARFGDDAVAVTDRGAFGVREHLTGLSEEERRRVVRVEDLPVERKGGSAPSWAFLAVDEEGLLLSGPGLATVLSQEDYERLL